ncbi:MAG: carboxymuconolactone decarboxylase family protein [Dehalococcoidia bacterium]
MARLPDPKPEDLSPEARVAYDNIMRSRGGLRGPFGMLMYNPPVADRVAALGEQLRFHSSFSGAERELAILAGGREVEAVYEWAAHEPIGLREGTRPEAIDVLRHQRPTDGLPEREALIIDTVRSIYRLHRLPDDLYRRALAAFGAAGLVEVIVLAGYYGMIGYILNAFEVDLPEGEQPAFARSWDAT